MKLKSISSFVIYSLFTFFNLCFSQDKLTKPDSLLQYLSQVNSFTTPIYLFNLHNENNKLIFYPKDLNFSNIKFEFSSDFNNKTLRLLQRIKYKIVYSNGKPEKTFDGYSESYLITNSGNNHNLHKLIVDTIYPFNKFIKQDFPIIIDTGDYYFIFTEDNKLNKFSVGNFNFPSTDSYNGQNYFSKHYQNIQVPYKIIKNSLIIETPVDIKLDKNFKIYAIKDNKNEIKVSNLKTNFNINLILKDLNLSTGSEVCYQKYSMVSVDDESKLLYFASENQTYINELDFNELIKYRIPFDEEITLIDDFIIMNQSELKNYNITPLELNSNFPKLITDSIIKNTSNIDNKEISNPSNEIVKTRIKTKDSIFFQSLKSLNINQLNSLDSLALLSPKLNSIFNDHLKLYNIIESSDNVKLEFMPKNIFDNLKYSTKLSKKKINKLTSKFKNILTRISYYEFENKVQVKLLIKYLSDSVTISDAFDLYYLDETLNFIIQKLKLKEEIKLNELEEILQNYTNTPLEILGKNINSNGNSSGKQSFYKAYNKFTFADKYTPPNEAKYRLIINLNHKNKCINGIYINFKPIFSQNDSQGFPSTTPCSPALINSKGKNLKVFLLNSKFKLHVKENEDNVYKSSYQEFYDIEGYNILWSISDRNKGSSSLRKVEDELKTILNSKELAFIKELKFDVIEK